MKNKQTGILSELMEIKASIIEIVFIAILLALSINLISSSITSYIHPEIVLIIGLLCLLVAFGYTIVRLFGNKIKIKLFEGFFIYDKESKNILSIPRYHYSQKIAEYLKSAFSENEALKYLWEQEPIEDIRKFENGELKFNHNHSLRLIVEATEYYLLNELSTHLTDYFDDEKYSENMLLEIARHDIPDVLLKNRFLEMFSKSITERPKFIGHASQQGYHIGNTNSELVYAMGKDGAIYNRFELILPVKSKLKRISENSIEIDTNRFRMIIIVDFGAFGTVINPKFYKYVLGIDNHKKIREYKVRININVHFKLSTFLSASGWEYYYWVDSFIEYFKKKFTQDNFFESIGWEQSLTVLDYLDLSQGKVAKKSTTKLPK